MSNTATQAEENALARVDESTPALSDMYAADAGAGLEDLSPSDLAVPFLTILQKASPQVDDADDRCVEGARPGMIFNTLTGATYDGKVGIPVVACGYQKMLTQWTPRDQGGGFIGHHHEGSPITQSSKVDDKGKRWTADGKYLLIDTAYYFLVAVPESGAFQAFLSMTSTQLKKSRKWNSMMKGIILRTRDGKAFNPPMYSHVYLLKTEPESNTQGNWYGWNITTVKMVENPDLYGAAKKFSEAVRSGSVRVGPPPSDDSQAQQGDVPF